MKRFGTPPHKYSFFKNLHEEMKENFFGFNCYLESKMIGSILVFYRGEEGYIAFNVSDSEYRQYRPNDLLYWEAIKKLIHAGVKKVNLGLVEKNPESSREKGLYKFKKKWNGRLFTRFYFYYFFGKGRNLEGSKKEGFKKTRGIWSALPSSLIRIIGPKICSELAI